MEQARRIISRWYSSLPPLNLDGLGLTELPTLPAGLLSLSCKDNRLTALPQLPETILELDCSNNLLTKLPKLHNNLMVLNCSNNRLTTLPEIPGSVYMLNFENNLLTDFPDLPKISEKLTLEQHFGTYLRCGENQFPDIENGEDVDTYCERLKKLRITGRCAVIKEELMERAWHPDRLASIIERFGSSPQWNHELCEYGTFDFTSIDEVL